MECHLDLLTRRAFLRTSLLGAALSWTIPVFLERTFMTLNAQAADSSIQAIGYPTPYRSHFRSTEIWQTASDAQQNLTKGWLGRYFDNCCAGEDPTVGVVLGEQLPEAFNAANPTGVAIGRPGNLGFDRENDPDQARLFAELNGLEPASMTGDSIGNLSGPSKSGMSALEYLQRTALDAQVSTVKIKQVLKGTKPEATYPKSQLGNS